MLITAKVFEIPKILCHAILKNYVFDTTFKPHHDNMQRILHDS